MSKLCSFFPLTFWGKWTLPLKLVIFFRVFFIMCKFQSAILLKMIINGTGSYYLGQPLNSLQVVFFRAFVMKFKSSTKFKTLPWKIADKNQGIQRTRHFNLAFEGMRASFIYLWHNWSCYRSYQTPWIDRNVYFHRNGIPFS